MYPRNKIAAGYVPVPSSEPNSDEGAHAKPCAAARRWIFLYRFVAVFITIACFCLGIAMGVLLTGLHLRPASSQVSCQNPVVRHEWRSLSKAEKGDYLQAVRCLRTIPSRLGLNQTLYDDFSYFHTRTGEQAHYTAAFLSWHRGFLNIYEHALRKQCAYTGHLTLFSPRSCLLNSPAYLIRYWDWSLDWEDITLAPVWDSVLGFGGNGNSSDSRPGFRGFCVTDGPFANLELLFIGPMDVPHCLSRDFLRGENLTTYAQRIRPQALEELLRLPSYEAFNEAVETGPHLSLPFSIHGDFSVPTAPQDPVFFLHHTQLDRLWWSWQERDLNKRLKDYGGKAVFNTTPATAGLKDLLPYGGLGESIRVEEIMDTRGGPLCYTY